MPKIVPLGWPQVHVPGHKSSSKMMMD